MQTDVQIGHQTIATFRNRYAWTADSHIENWSTDLLSHFLSFFIIELTIKLFMTDFE